MNDFTVFDVAFPSEAKQRVIVNTDAKNEADDQYAIVQAVLTPSFELHGPGLSYLLASRLKAPIVTNQIEFSLIHLDPISDGTFDLAIKVGHKPMIWSPVGGGRLLTRGDDYIVKVGEKLAEITNAYGLDGPANAAISFVARHPSNSVIVLGTGKQERIEGAMKAVHTQLDRADWYDIVFVTHPRLFF